MSDESHKHRYDPACACGAELDMLRGSSYVIVPADPDDPPPPPPEDCQACGKPAAHIGDRRPWRPIRDHDEWCDFSPDDTVRDHYRDALSRIATSARPFLGSEMRQVAKDALRKYGGDAL
jgi:hypothetical protein